MRCNSKRVCFPRLFVLLGCFVPRMVCPKTVCVTHFFVPRCMCSEYACVLQVHCSKGACIPRVHSETPPIASVDFVLRPPWEQNHKALRNRTGACVLRSSFTFPLLLCKSMFYYFVIFLLHITKEKKFEEGSWISNNHNATITPALHRNDNSTDGATQNRFISLSSRTASVQCYSSSPCHQQHARSGPHQSRLPGCLGGAALPPPPLVPSPPPPPRSFSLSFRICSYNYSLYVSFYAYAYSSGGKCY